MLIFFCTNRKIDWYLKSHFFLNQYIFTSLFFCGINVVSKDCTSKIEFIVSSSSNFPYDYVVKDTQTWMMRVAADDNNSHRLRNYFVDSKKKNESKSENIDCLSWRHVFSRSRGKNSNTVLRYVLKKWHFLQFFVSADDKSLKIFFCSF